MKVLVINYGMGNLASVRRAFEESGADVTVSGDPTALADAERIILPGVGAFADGMTHLQAAGWPDRLRESLQNPKVRLLGICLGMQLLAEEGMEGGNSRGLGLIPGRVVRLEPTAGNERIPHVGWNEIRSKRQDVLLRDIADDTDFYFVHSFHFIPRDEPDAIATTPYCGQFVSVVGRENVFGVQFHPEKSSKAGARLLRNFLAA